MRYFLLLIIVAWALLASHAQPLTAAPCGYYVQVRHPQPRMPNAAERSLPTAEQRTAPWLPCHGPLCQGQPISPITPVAPAPVPGERQDGLGFECCSSGTGGFGLFTEPPLFALLSLSASPPVPPPRNVAG